MCLWETDDGRLADQVLDGVLVLTLPGFGFTGPGVKGETPNVVRNDPWEERDSRGNFTRGVYSEKKIIIKKNKKIQVKVFC